MNTYGLHSIHGRAPAIATGLATTRPDLDVWVVTGDGDALSIGGTTSSTRCGATCASRSSCSTTRSTASRRAVLADVGGGQGHQVDAVRVGGRAFNPVSLALGAEATFVARTHDMDRAHMQETFRRAHEHDGAAFVEVYQNCNVFNDGAFAEITGKEVRSDMLIPLHHGEPIRFGAESQRGVVQRSDGRLEIVDVAEVGEGALLVHDEQRADPGLAFALSRLANGPHQPTPIGVFRSVERSEYGEEMERQITVAQDRRGVGDLATLFRSGSSWTVD